MDYFIHPTAVVEKEVKIGKGSRIWHFAHVREGVDIGENCTIGKDVFVDSGVKIGNKVKIQNGVSVYKGVEVNDEVFIGPYATFTNDMYPRASDTEWEVIPTILGKGASIGANATILCGVRLGNYAMIAAGSVLTTNAVPYGLYVGNPARLKNMVSPDGCEMKLVEFLPDVLRYRCERSKRVLEITFSIKKDD